MNNKIPQVILSAAFTLIISACANPISQWESAPISPATDMAKLKAQIKANPDEWTAALKFLKDSDLMAIELGRHDITENTFANVQEYTSLLEGNYEAHRKYIDIQVVISGNENIFVAPLDKAVNLIHEYDESAGDFVLYADADNVNTINANFENWVVLFPNEAHKPGMAISKPSPIRKVVVKIPYAE